ncbi:MAG: hydroxymethylbilane synthase [Verrucomicrobiales bacterium]
MENRCLRLGTRGSALALKQVELTEAKLSLSGHQLYKRVIISTRGDREVDSTAQQVGILNPGIFTKELEISLLDGKIDLAVHSVKDMPSLMDHQLCLAGFLPREDWHDVLITRNGSHLADLPEGAVVATGSVRRRAQLLARRPDLQIVGIRGNVPTRIKKFEENTSWAGLVLAEAGLRRLELLDGVEGLMHLRDKLGVVRLDFLPAPCQGIVGWQVRASDSFLLSLLNTVNDAQSKIAAEVERAWMAELQLGCQTPAAALAVPLPDGSVEFSAELFYPGHQRITVRGDANDVVGAWCEELQRAQ